jgi:hypothetical protein
MTAVQGALRDWHARIRLRRWMRAGLRRYIHKPRLFFHTPTEILLQPPEALRDPLHGRGFEHRTHRGFQGRDLVAPQVPRRRCGPKSGPGGRGGNQNSCEQFGTELGYLYGDGPTRSQI